MECPVLSLGLADKVGEQDKKLQNLVSSLQSWDGRTATD